jgi:hypothetical protein
MDRQLEAAGDLERRIAGLLNNSSGPGESDGVCTQHRREGQHPDEPSQFVPSQAPSANIMVAMGRDTKGISPVERKYGRHPLFWRAGLSPILGSKICSTKEQEELSEVE